MQAVLFDEYGPPDVLTLREIAPDPLGVHDVRIRVMTAGVQPFDCATRRGDFAQYSRLALPSRLGNEIAGVVIDAGSGVDRGVVGREVIAFCDMVGYASEVVLPIAHVVPRPSALTWEQSGALAVSGQTADTALDALGVGHGDRLLIHASSGGVGSMAAQLARVRGATVFGTSSQRNHEYLANLGAEPVAYGEGLVETMQTRGGVDKVLDCVGGDALDQSLALVDRSRVVTVADWARSAQLGIRRIGTDRSAGRLTRLVGLAEIGELTVSVQEVFPLGRAPSAHRSVETGHVRGKVVLAADG